MLNLAARTGLAVLPLVFWSMAHSTPKTEAQNSYNCSDFGTDFGAWRRAQNAFYDAGGPAYDPNWLDDDRDGLACESLLSAYDLDCAELTFAEAQEINVQYSWMNLDPNGDGIACG